MSYILEALKKAQAERQLGNTPGIHDVPGPSVAPRAAPVNPRAWIALGAALVLAGGGFAIVRSLGGAEGQAGAAGPAPVPVVVATPSPAPHVLVTAPAQAAAQQARAAAMEAAPAPAPVAQPSPARQPQPQPQPQSQPQPQPQPQPQSADAVPTLAGLPASVAAGIPRVTLGGYIYSPVPSERLLLVDKDLRREGEEVVPGLVLEKLLPDGAVMNYRGTRFRMPY